MAVSSNYIFWIVESGVIFLTWYGLENKRLPIWKLDLTNRFVLFFNASLDQLPYQIKVLFEFNIFSQTATKEKAAFRNYAHFKLISS